MIAVSAFVPPLANHIGNMGNGGGVLTVQPEGEVGNLGGGKQFFGCSMAIVTGGIVGIFPVEIVTGEQVCLGHGRGR